MIAEYNLLANDFDWFRIGGYPTLIMFKAGDKQNHITYEGNRTVEDMMNFVISNLGEVKEEKEEEAKKPKEEKHVPGPSYYEPDKILRAIKQKKEFNFNMEMNWI